MRKIIICIITISSLFLVTCDNERIKIKKITFEDTSVICEVLPPDSYNSIRFVSNAVAYTVSGSGKIYITEDGGNNWTSQISGTDLPLLNIFFLDEMNGYIVGGGNQQGIILKTTNGGSTWSLKSFQVQDKLHEIHLINNTIGFSVGQGILLKTTDGGESWNEINLGGFYNMGDIGFYDENTGFISASPASLKTIDGGNTWTELSNKDIRGSVQIVENKIAFLYTSGKIFKTVDKGNTWTVINNVPGISSFHFINECQAVAVGQRYPPLGFFPSGVLYITNDGGRSWDERLTEGIDEFYHLIDIGSPNDSTFLAVGQTNRGCVVQLILQ